MTSRRARLVALAAALGVALAGQVTLGSETASAAACETSSAPGGYSVTVCLTSHTDDDELTGAENVTATVTVSPVTAAVVDRVLFFFRDAYLLSDHDPAYQMIFRTDRLPDGPGRLEVRADMTDGFESSRSDVPVTLFNPTPRPPNTQQFGPRLGTPPGHGERFRIAAVGDGVDGSPAGAAVADLIDSMQPDVLAYLGDVYGRGTPYEFDTWYGDPPTDFGRFRAITNPTVGNHEYMGDPAAAGYFEFWDNIPHYYSYDVGGWHVVVLDSTTEFAQVAPGTAQYAWLAADLAANQGRCTITYLHHPRYAAVSRIGREDLAPMWSLLVEQGVTLMVAGHAHTYERWTPLNGSGSADPRGMTQIIAGTGGRPIISPKTPEPLVLSDHTTPGALQLDLGTDDARFAFVDTDRNVLDAGTIPCRRPPDTTAPTTPGGLAATGVSPTAANVSWTPSSDAVGVTGYTVRRGGVEVATLGDAATTYLDPGLAPERPYSWTVEAFDAAGNRSPPTSEATATTPFPRRATRDLLRRLRRAPEHPAGYRPARFPGWTDADGDRCVTAIEVLLEEAVRAPAVRRRCALTGGRWFSPYDGVTRTGSGRLVVDHLVPLSEAWQSGAYRWAKITRRQHANDLGYPSSLVAVSRAAAAVKDRQEPQSWMPRKAYRCSYAAQWVAVKWRWRLAVDPAERRFLVRTLTSCGWPTVRATSRVPIRR